MSTIATYSQLTLIELAKRRDPNGNMAVIAEVLNRDNPIVQDAPYLEANQATSHKIVRRSSIPTASWRRVNQGVAPTASTTINIVEPIGMLEAYSSPDKALVDMSPDPSAFRMQEAAAFIEGMGQQLATAAFYGNTATDPEQIDGLAPRMATLDEDGLVVSCGGSGNDCTSLYVVLWGPSYAYMIYPKGHPYAGIERNDKGVETIYDASGNPMEAYRDHFSAKVGLAVAHTEAIARVANIETSGSSNTFDEDKLITVLNRMPMSGSGATIYCNDTIKTQMEIRLKDKTNVNFAVQQGLGGAQVLQFRGVPVKKCDAILNTEAAIS